MVHVLIAHVELRRLEEVSRESQIQLFHIVRWPSCYVRVLSIVKINYNKTLNDSINWTSE